MTAAQERPTSTPGDQERPDSSPLGDHHDDDTQRIVFRPSRLRQCEWKPLALRFTLGAAISLVAGIIAEVQGERFGGLFLAFPAILPATVTLLESTHSNRHARHDSYGAACAVPGLASFALTVYLLRDHPAIALPAATAAWLFTALVLFALYQRVRRAVGSRTAT